MVHAPCFFNLPGNSQVFFGPDSGDLPLSAVREGSTGETAIFHVSLKDVLVRFSILA